MTHRTAIALFILLASIGATCGLVGWAGML
jgi:hypothetical protein